jgi:hypothetical protein
MGRTASEEENFYWWETIWRWVRGALRLRLGWGSWRPVGACPPCRGPEMFRVKEAGEEGYPRELCPLPAGQGVCLGLGTDLAVYIPSEVDSRLLG